LKQSKVDFYFFIPFELGSHNVNKNIVTYNWCAGYAEQETLSPTVDENIVGSSLAEARELHDLPQALGLISGFHFWYD